MRGCRASGQREVVGSCPASALGPLTSSVMGESERGCAGAKRMVPRVIPRFGKTEVWRELQPGVWKWLSHLGMLDGSFGVAGSGAYIRCEDNI